MEEEKIVIEKEKTYSIPKEYKPIGAWAYFGWQLLFAIPIVGWILLIVFACGGANNKNLINFARSYFCWLLFVIIISVVIISTGIAAFQGFLSTLV